MGTRGEERMGTRGVKRMRLEVGTKDGGIQVEEEWRLLT